MLDKKLSTQNDALGKICGELRDIGTEHGGIWVYGSGDDSERQHRRQVTDAEERQQQELMDELLRRQQRYRPPAAAQPDQQGEPEGSKVPARAKSPEHT